LSGNKVNRFEVSNYYYVPLLGNNSTKISGGEKGTAAQAYDAPLQDLAKAASL
jgi:hypothetical protein